MPEKRESTLEAMKAAKFIEKKSNDKMLEVTIFIAEKSSNIHNDHVFEVSENTQILKQFLAYLDYLGLFFFGFNKNT